MLSLEVHRYDRGKSWRNVDVGTEFLGSAAQIICVSARISLSIYDIWISKYHLRCLKDRCVRVPPLKGIANAQ